MKSDVALLMSPLFNGLTRPPMIMGVTMDYLSLCALCALCIFILANSPVYLIIYFPLHLLGWIACKIDHNIFRILLKCADCAYAPNKNIWGCHSYEAF